jgi:hypothetical protein
VSLRRRSIALGLLAALSSAAPGWGNEVLFRSPVVTCVATTPNITRMWVEGVSFRLAAERSWAQGKVNILMRDKSQLQYRVRGEAAQIKKDLPRNDARRSFSYGGVNCTVSHRSITSVSACRGGRETRTCEVGVTFGGAQRAYRVSLTVQPLTARVAAAPLRP